MSMDRHEKWTPAEPGTEFVFGQPYRIEWQGGISRAGEYVASNPLIVPDDRPRRWFVDSSWKPPLVLPTEPTWGIAYLPDTEHGDLVGLWRRWTEEGVEYLSEMECGWHRWPVSEVRDFIPLTDEQVARIEAVR